MPALSSSSPDPLAPAQIQSRGMGVETPEVPGHELIRPIGKGAFGQVWLGRNNVIWTYRAVKVIENSTVHPQHFDREFKGIQRFEPVSRLHQGLVDILQVGRAPDGSYFYYVM